MIALIHKELRLAADVVIGATVFLFAALPLAILGIAMQGISPFPWISVVGAGCVLNQYTMVLTSALLGAATFAREREEGNQHFLALLPLTKTRTLAAKFTACVMIWMALWTLNALILIGFSLAIGQGLTPLMPFLPRMLGVVSISFAALGWAALAGGTISSVTGAAVAGLVVVAFTAGARIVWMTYEGAGNYFSASFVLLLGFLGTTGLAISASAFGHEGAADVAAVRPAKRPLYPVCYHFPRNAWGITRSLLWKDIRLQRPAFLSGFVLLCLPYIAAAGNALLSGDAAVGFRAASLVAIATGWIVLPVWSAGTLAGEWETSSNQFLAYLPVSSTRIAAAKFFVAFVPSLIVSLSGIACFSVAQCVITGVAPVRLVMSWDEFNATGYLAGAVAYAYALPVTFCTAWFFAARLRRRIVPVILGVVSGPAAMASWAVTGAPGGYLAGHCTPLQTMGIHGAIVAVLCAGLLGLGTMRLLPHGFNE